MNKKLYESIKQELVALPEYLAAPELVRSKLIENLDGKNQVDYFTTLYAFYEYMNDKADFSFMRTETWIDFFKQAFNSCFTDQNINDYLETFATMPEVLDVVLTQCSDNVKEKIYNAFKNSHKLEDYNYKIAYNTIAKKLGYTYESKEEQPLIEEPNLDEILSKYNEEPEETTDNKSETSFEEFANSFNTDLEQEKEAVPIEIKPVEVEKGTVPTSFESNVEPIAPVTSEEVVQQQEEDKPIIVNDISLDREPVLEEKSTYTDQEIIPDIGINKEVTSSVEQAFTPSVVASNNIVQMVKKDVFDKLELRIIESRASRPYELDNTIPNVLNGNVSSDRIATVDKETLYDIVNATLVNKVLTNIVPQWQQNGILSKISTKYKDADTKVKIMA